MLQAERYPYYGDAADESENQVDSGDFYSEDQNPYYVHDDWKAASVIREEGKKFFIEKMHRYFPNNTIEYIV